MKRRKRGEELKRRKEEGNVCGVCVCAEKREEKREEKEEEEKASGR
jgi:hypothetical protein